ncbi:TRIC cation channel family protein [Sandaracinobacter sp. RS1-74]|uniref:trimeric intracellular cation channel family protein n=1 Tax=Sandaracinobacteroides sayramensis TaxID=2913411 RepID=UPI001EDA0E0B|nr:TRIC cation channel family protein [Sandaracinobacteroides sayramensis]MCG2841569.1 TRIC cation channel family protein [Sandaracinobacteroides sayramensis]
MDAEAFEHLKRVFLALDYVGVFIFAVTGALVAARVRQDFVTCAFFAGMTGMGGGTVRDLLIGAPVFWMGHGWFVAVCLVATLAVWILRTEQWPGKPLRWLDALGLSAYCAFGSLKALSFGVDPVPAALMGVLTATFGGIIRDMMAGQPSVLMQREIYVTAAIAGAAATVLLAAGFGLHSWVAGGAGAAIAFAIRASALIWGWKLPIHPG